MVFHTPAGKQRHVAFPGKCGHMLAIMSTDIILNRNQLRHCIYGFFDDVERYRPLAQRRHQHDWQFLSHCFIVCKQQIVIVVLRPVSGRSDYSIHAAFPGKTDKLNPICFGVVL